MKHSVEELYQWSVENDQLNQLVEALYFNDRGLVVRPLKGNLVKKENQFYYVAKVNDDFTVEEPIGDGSEKQNAILEKVKSNPEVMMVSIIAYEQKYRLRFVFAETEEERKEAIHKKMIFDMLRILEIDTIGKMKNLIQQSSNLRANREAMNIIAKGFKKGVEEKEK